MSQLIANFLFSYDNFTLDVELACPSTCILGIKGDMGSGKSTLFNCLMGLRKPAKGMISWGDDIYWSSSDSINKTPQKRAFAYLFQEDRIFDHLSVQSNLLYAWRSVTNPLTRSLNQNSLPPNYENIINLLELEVLLKRRSKQLSGGEKRRLALGRTLLSSFELLILDEPFRSLSPELASGLINYIQGLSNLSVIFSSHQEALFSRLSNHSAQIDNGKLSFS